MMVLQSAPTQSTECDAAAVDRQEQWIRQLIMKGVSGCADHQRSLSAAIGVTTSHVVQPRGPWIQWRLAVVTHCSVVDG